MEYASHFESEEKTGCAAERGHLDRIVGQLQDAQLVIPVRAVDPVGEPAAVRREASVSAGPAKVSH